MSTRVKITSSALLIFAAFIYLFAWSSVFSVKTITTTGAPAVINEASIISKSQIQIGEKLSRIDPRSIERSLGELSWVKEVSVARDWIKGNVNIQLLPRIPVGVYKGRAIDNEGTLFEFPGNAPSDLPVVSAASPQLGLEAISLFTRLPLELRQSTLSVSASNENSISSLQLQQNRKLKVTWGSSRDLDLKVTVLKALLALPENQAIKRVDLSAPHAPIVK